NKTVLEIGTSTGSTSKILKERKNQVTGIEIEKEAGSMARQYCDRMIIADIELLNLDESLKVASFDVILCEDVLEHLKNPGLLLKRLRKFLKPDGYLVVSLPNFFQGDVILHLLSGDFHSTPMEFLDEAHLHFFGLKNMYAIFTECGYQIRDLHRIHLDMGTTELKVETPKIPRELLKFIRSLPESRVCRYVFTAYPSERIIQPAIGETDMNKLFFDAFQNYRQKLQLPSEAKSTEQEKNLKDLTSEELELIVASEDELIGELTDNITSLRQAISNLSLDQRFEKMSVQFDRLEENLGKLNQQMHEITAKALALTREGAVKDYQIQEQLARIQTLEQVISRIENSIVWQLTMKFHTKVVEHLLPPNTRRRRFYDVGRAEGQILIRDGMKAFHQSFIRHFHLHNKLNDYQKWMKKNEPVADALDQLEMISRDFSYRPKISIITPVWNVDKKWLCLAVESVINQVYDNWELCIVDGGSTNQHIGQILKEYAQQDPRIKVKFLAENKGIAENSNEALSLATGEFIGFLDHDDELAPFALYEVSSRLNQNQSLHFIYSDEDKIDRKGNRKDPFFKPDWSPDLFLSQNYLCHFSVIRKTLIDSIEGFREGYEGSQDYDLFLRCTEKVPPSTIVHIPKILYHWRTIGSSAANKSLTKPYALISAKKALTDALTRRGIQGEVVDGAFLSTYRIRYTIQDNPKITIVIPTKDKVEILQRCIQSILDKTEYKNYEIVIVDNQSRDARTFRYYMTMESNPRIKVLHFDKPFNFSAINNYAVANVDSPYVLFLNNDTEVISHEWLSAMLEHAQRTGVGAVGAKLLYPNNSIQHAGVILGLRGILGQKSVAGHSHKYLPDKYTGNFLRAQIIGNYSAVTAACLMMRKDVFLEVGGFSEDFAIAFNDVDLCLKVKQRGYLIVYTPYAKLYHHESISRGYETTSEKQVRFFQEAWLIRERWGAVIDKGDPYYNPNLTLESEDCSINLDSMPDVL
ncbi:MAG TPA: glycosyltransferase, partial [Syntrophales bacterium]|nr:glycosyltransferase [Syntrophales bacterium]